MSDLYYDADDMNLYVTGGEGGLEIWDVSDQLSPGHLSTTEVLYFDVETPVRSVEVYQDYAVTENSFGYVHLLDVSDPASPVDVAFNGVMGNPSHEIHVSQADGQIHATGAQYYARLGIGGGSLTVTAQKEFLYGAGAVFGTPEIAYVGYGGGLYLLDLLLPGLPPWSIIDTGGVTDVVAEDGNAYVINEDGLRILDVAVPDDPSTLSVLSVDPWPRDFVIAGSYAYVATRIGGLKVIDISDAQAPFEAGGYPDIYAIAWQTEVVDGLAYMAHSASGLTILDLYDLSHPQHLASTGSLDETRDVAYQDGRAYVADANAGVRIFDVSQPDQPQEIGGTGGFYEGEFLDLLGGRVRQGHEGKLVLIVRNEEPIGQQAVSMGMQVERPTEALHECDRAGLPCAYVERPSAATLPGEEGSQVG